ncbi:MAG: hypothetical protein U9R42_07090 [Bacteroidota bacterium]|nr:hypothetical protein [Bacteroidota bacterium]
MITIFNKNKFSTVNSIVFVAIFLFSGLIVNSAFAKNYEGIFENANKLYQEKKYNEAIILYDSIESSNYESAELYFNRANAFYKLKKYPSAILNYEKAKLFDGSNKDIDFNLQLANLNIVDKIEPLPELLFFKTWYQLLNVFPSKKWAFISLAFLWMTLILLIVLIFTSRHRLKKISSLLTLIFIMFFLFTSYLSFKRYKIETQHNFAIIFSPLVYVKSAPDEGSTELFIIHEGLKVKILENVDSWFEIKLADGKTGWLQEDDLKKI